MQSKIATQHSFNLASAPLPGFPNDNFYRYYDNNRLNNRRSRPYKPYITRGRDRGGYTKNYQGMFHRGNKRSQDRVNFIQIEAISDPEVMKDHFKSLIEVQMLEEAKVDQKQLIRIKQVDVFNVISYSIKLKTAQS